MARRRLVTVLTVVALVLIGVGLVWSWQGRLIYLPDASPVPPARVALPGARDVRLTTTDGLELGAWYLPPARSCEGVVLVAQGNGGNRGDRVELARAVAARGFGVLLFDYRGYGGSPGVPSEAGLARDALAAHDHLVGEVGVAPEHLVYLGESLGTGVVTALAVEHPPAALVLRSPFTSLADAGRVAAGVPVGWLLRDRYEVRAQVARVGAPVAVVYGTADTIVPADQSRRVAQAAREAGLTVVEREVLGAGHNDPLLAHGADLVGALVEAAAAGGIGGCG